VRHQQPAFETDLWLEVNSSLVVAVGTVGDFLVVQFRNGDIYRYPDMAGEYESLVTAESVGKYFHQEIRSQPCQKLTRGEWPTED